ncbi:hypothetical protein [Mycolicibacterium palauense]|uniref:hypothetical protein n=1 Tax=Mycolicibacterium palauense TaxID=2034511 RepID=UPI000BFF108A|nr:hypothetical protein [Mycolicibacterium palauense]
MYTLHTTTLSRLALASTTLDADDTVNGATIDLALFKNNFRSALFIVTAGAVTDGTHEFAVEHSDDGADWSAVPADRIQGVLPTFDDAASDTVEQFGYIVATQRYVRLTVTTADSTDGGVLSAVAVLANGATSPPARA